MKPSHNTHYATYHDYVKVRGSVAFSTLVDAYRHIYNKLNRVKSRPDSEFVDGLFTAYISTLDYLRDCLRSLDPKCPFDLLEHGNDL